MRLAKLIPRIRVKRICRLASSADYWTRLVTVKTVGRSVWTRLWQQVGGDPLKVPDLANLAPDGGSDAARGAPELGNWRQEEMKAWMALRVQGVGAGLFRDDRLSNSWLADPAKVGFRQRHYIAGLKLRAGTYPTKEFLSRGRNKEGAACRRCGARLESCSHILGQCPYTKGSRVHRHHKMCDLLAAEAERAGWSVIREFRLEDPAEGLRIPDLVCTKGDVALVLDVTVRYEYGPSSLRGAASEKVARYNPVKELIGAAVGARTVHVLGFPIGCRGKWPSCNTAILRQLGLTAGRRAFVAKLMSRRALLYSLWVLRRFLCDSAGPAP